MATELSKKLQANLNGLIKAEVVHGLDMIPGVTVPYIPWLSTPDQIYVYEQLFGPQENFWKIPLQYGRVEQIKFRKDCLLEVYTVVDSKMEYLLIMNPLTGEIESGKPAYECYEPLDQSERFSLEQLRGLI